MDMNLNQKAHRAKTLIKKYADANRNRFAISFSGGKDSALVVHLAREALKGEHLAKTFAVLADTEFPETVDYIHKYSPLTAFYYYENTGDPDDCCRTPKVEKFKEAVKDLDCWFSGIRVDEGITRADFKEVEEIDGLVKVNPILHFTEKDVWRYIAIHGIPVNQKYKEGYRSLSCANCSVKETSSDEPERAGRWKGTKHEGKECGIHTKSLRKK